MVELGIEKFASLQEFKVREILLCLIKELAHTCAFISAIIE
jgi:hypothetical protein